MKVLKFLAKNLLVFILGAIIGIIGFFFYFLRIWLPMQAAQVGLGAIGLLPVAIIFSLILGTIIGGAAALIVYYLIKKIKNKK